MITQDLNLHHWELYFRKANFAANLMKAKSEAEGKNVAKHCSSHCSRQKLSQHMNCENFSMNITQACFIVKKVRSIAAILASFNHMAFVLELSFQFFDKVHLWLALLAAKPQGLETS